MSTYLNVQRQYLAGFVNSIMALTDQALITATPEGLQFAGVDARFVAMVSSTLDKQGCEDYHTQEMPLEAGCGPRLNDHFAALLEDLEGRLDLPYSGQPKMGPAAYGVDLERFKAMFLKGGNPMDTLRMTFSDDGKSLQVSYPITRQGDRATMTMELLSKEGFRVPLRPRMNLLGTFVVNTESFFAAVAAVGQISDNVTITHESGQVTLSAVECDANNKVVVPIGHSYTGPQGHVHSKFPIEYMSSMAKTLRGFKQIRVAFDTDKPCSMTAKVLTAQGQPAVTVEYLLAPQYCE